MPKYVYRCKSCDTMMVKYHSIKARLEDCEHCGEEDSLERVPGNVTMNVSRKESGGKVGSVVKRKIEEYTEDLKKQKKDLRGGVFEE